MTAHYVRVHGFIERSGPAVLVFMESFARNVPILKGSMWTPIIINCGGDHGEEAFVLCTLFNEDDKSISWMVFQLGGGAPPEPGESGEKRKYEAMFSVRNDLSEVSKNLWYCVMHHVKGSFLADIYFLFLVKRVFLDTSNCGSLTCQVSNEVTSTKSSGEFSHGELYRHGRKPYRGIHSVVHERLEKL